MDLNQLTSAFEESLNVKITLHDYSGCLKADLAPACQQHTCGPCAAVKELNQAACSEFDIRVVRQNLIRHPEGFWKVCHAGILELYLPVRDGDTLSAGLFVGVWRPEAAAEFPEDWVLDEQVTRKAQKIAASLPGLAARDRPRLRAMAQSLKLALERLLAIQKPVAGIPPSRKTAIEGFLRQHFREPVALADLAAYLHLTPSRAGQLVRGLWGRTFPEFLNSLRLDHARKLLAFSPFSIQEIARVSGFPDPAYFHRRFRREFGLTPLACRKQAAAENREVRGGP
jgi:AraC-like DNA-binding protein